MSTLDEVVRQTQQLAASMQRLPRDIVTQSAQTYTRFIRASIASTTNGGRLRGVGKKGARVGVKYNVKGDTNPSAIVQATGPLQLLERDTRAHDIPRTVGSRRLRTASGRLSRTREVTGRTLSGSKPLLINGQWVTGPVRHPGTKGKHPFERGVTAAEIAAFADAVKEFTSAIGNALR